MMKFLGLRFWILCFLLGGTILSFHPRMNLHSKIAHNLTLTPQASDEIKTLQSAAMRVMPDTGLSLVTEQRLKSFMLTLSRQEVESMGATQNEWLHYAKAWFERVYPNEARYNQYVEAWLSHREQKAELRESLRQRYFPDYSDRELMLKAEWLQSQEEWGEMNAKIDSGIRELEGQYQSQVELILGDKMEAFTKLHGLFVKDYFSESGAPENFFL